MRQELHDHRRAKILAAAHRVFLAKGFTRAKVEDIAKAARVANATVYTHFGAKNALFEAVIGQAMRPYAGLFDEVERVAGDAQAVLTRFALVYFRFMADPNVRGVYRIVSAEVEHRPALGEGLYRQAHELLGGHLRRILTRLHDTGELAVEDPAIASRLFEGMIEHATLTISMLGGNEAEPLHPAEPYCQEAVRIFLAGYSAAR